jgi:hypothetical protein
MIIGLHDSERENGYPNLALMKLSALHKAHGNHVEWFSQFNSYDKVYSSKVFTFTPADPFIPGFAVRGGTGYGTNIKLPEAAEKMCPDYSLYGCDRSYGFLTRGCPNKCEWCFVPEKEGDIRPAADIEEFLRHDKCVLMDNNVLASDHGIRQIEKIARLGIKVDFNQGLDARLIDGPMARLLSKVKWLDPLRLACDRQSQMPAIQKAVQHLRYHNCTPGRYFVYVLVRDIEDALERVKFLKGLWLDPFAQAYRDKDGNPPSKEQLDFERWVNMRAVNKTTTWEEYGQSKKRKTAAPTTKQMVLGFAQ